MNWDKYLQPELLASFSLAKDKSTLSRAFHTLEFNYGDMYLRFQYGMHNPDYPGVIKRKIFTLDYDAHCNQTIERGAIPQFLNRFHDCINESFENVITDNLRKKMGVINGD